MSIETTARRLADHPRFRWEGGQLTLCGVRLSEGGKGYIIGNRPGATCDGGGDIDTTDVSEFAPNLNDNPTIGSIEGQARAICPGLILFPPENPGQMWAIGRDVLTCLAYAPSIGECWALAFLEVAK